MLYNSLPVQSSAASSHLEVSWTCKNNSLGFIIDSETLILFGGSADQRCYIVCSRECLGKRHIGVAIDIFDKRIPIVDTTNLSIAVAQIGPLL